MGEEKLSDQEAHKLMNLMGVLFERISDPILYWKSQDVDKGLFMDVCSAFWDKCSYTKEEILEDIKEEDQATF